MERAKKRYSCPTYRLWEKYFGKILLNAMIMEKINRSTLVLVPTIELLIQWHKNLKEYFSCKIKMLGGGSKEIEPITVSTYDSARIYHEKLGNTFCLD